jgi:hypothetical protein
LNARGFGVKAGYAFTDFLVGNLTYLYGEKISDVNGAAILNSNIQTWNRASVLQVDLSVRF